MRSPRGVAENLGYQYCETPLLEIAVEKRLSVGVCDTKDSFVFLGAADVSVVTGKMVNNNRRLLKVSQIVGISKMAIGGGSSAVVLTI